MDSEALSKEIQRLKLTDEEVKQVLKNLKNPPEKPVSTVQHHWGTKHTKFGLCSDLHIGSKYADYNSIDDLFKRFKSEKVDAVYIVGDITEGYNRRKGQEFECDLHGADQQVKGVVDKIPRIGKDIYFILGDHDSWHYENAGVDIGKMIESQRTDMHSLGFFDAKVKLHKNSVLELQHPGKGTAYAISYQIQKMIESFSGGEKPNILAVGHYHKSETLFYRNVYAIQTGCLESQTAWMRRMNLSAHKGGWIVDAFFDSKGSIDKLTTTFFPYYA